MIKKIISIAETKAATKMPIISLSGNLGNTQATILALNLINKLNLKNLKLEIAALKKFKNQMQMYRHGYYTGIYKNNYPQKEMVEFTVDPKYQDLKPWSPEWYRYINPSQQRYVRDLLAEVTGDSKVIQEYMKVANPLKVLRYEDSHMGTVATDKEIENIYYDFVSSSNYVGTAFNALYGACKSRVKF